MPRQTQAWATINDGWENSDRPQTAADHYIPGIAGAYFLGCVEVDALA